ncbi:MAG: type IX secretion system sortase PorU [Bacteroidota bacterium]
MLTNLKPSIVLVFTFIALNTAIAQKVASSVQKKIDWLSETSGKSPALKDFSIVKYNFNGIKRLSVQFTVATSTKSIVTISNPVYEELKGYIDYTILNEAYIPQNLEYTTYYTLEGSKGYTGIVVTPFIKDGGKILKLVSFDYTLTDGESFATSLQNSKKRAASTSVLGTGKWIKFSVNKDGIYKIDANWLSSAGINLSGIDPRTIKIYGHQGGMISELNLNPNAFNDIPENAIQVVGEADGKFDASDYILFYAQSPNKWVFDNAMNRYKHVINIYSENTYFFLTYDGGAGKRISTKQDGSGLTATRSFDWFSYHTFHDEEKENICKQGRITLGEKFDATTSYTFNENIPNIDGTKNTSIFFFGVSTAVVSSQLSMFVNNSFARSLNFGPLDNPDDPPCFMESGVATHSFILDNPQLSLSFSYNKPITSAKAWLDYYEIHSTRKLKFSEGFMPFSTVESATEMVSEYRLTDLPASFQIFDISDPLNVKLQNTFSDNGAVVFRDNSSNSLHEFALNDGNTFTPTFIGDVPNQNLHATGIVQYIIVSPPEFKDAANKLADYHRTNSNLQVLVTSPQEIYNEFSSGSQDISGIRDFFKHVYYSNTNPTNQLRYALLFGDASYDYKNKVKDNNNFVPTFESDPILNPDHGAYYCSDDFFGFLDPGDGAWNDEQKLEIPVCRLPVATPTEAMDMVNKIFRYKEIATLGDWRNRVSFLADDVDDSWEGVFVNDFETVFKSLDSTYKNLNVTKIYLDAYPQQNLGGSQRYPDAQTAIKQDFNNGTLIFNYLGHGGEEYLASEKVLDIPLVKALTNINTMPAVFTGSCTISKYDDATHKSGGEYLINNPNGGAIAMFSTVRIVYVVENFEINEYFWNNCAFVKIGGEWPTLGQIYKKLKNRDKQRSNDRKFVLLADPALTLNYPENFAVIDSMNSRSVAGGADTIKALSKVIFKGHIEDISGNLMTGFNGSLFPTVFDKKATFYTLGNNIHNIKSPFQLYNNILYKGESSVDKGLFSFGFVVPKDIAYNYGFGKVSLYAQDASANTDASGNYGKLIVGGTASNVVPDNAGPVIELFVDDYSFISGGLTDKTPLLLAKLADDNGINTTGSGIGRDLVITIDKGTANEKTYIVNSYYKSKLNSYTEGELKYQLEGIAEGKHTYTLKAWDVFNNSSEATIEFNVSSSDEFEIKNVLNYPNPFSSNTTFHFDHNRAGQNLNITITILTITGKVIKTIEQYIPSANGHVSEIAWNGRDDYDDKPSKGVYIYRISIKTDDGQSAEKIEKMVILN